MTARQEFEGDGKTSRSYSLASAPLRLLSHSFHSTANTHSTSSNSNPSSSTPLAQPHVDQHHHTHAELLLKESYVQESPNPCHEHTPNNTSHAIPPSADHESFGKRLQSPAPLSTLRQQQQQPASQPQPLLAQAQHFLDERSSRSTAARGSESLNDSPDDDPLSSGPWRKTLKVATQEGVVEAVPPAHVRQGRLSVSQQPMGALERLERLLVPYDIRHSIFGELALQDIYHLQLVSGWHSTFPT